MAKIVVGSFDNYEEARQIAGILEQNGIHQDDISLLAKHDADDGSDALTETQQDAATGAVAGSAIGGAAGLVAGLTGLALPGIGAVIAAGPIVAAVTGAGMGALAGGAIGALKHLGVDHDAAEGYAENLCSGGALVIAHTDDEHAERAASLMASFGADSVDPDSHEIYAAENVASSTTTQGVRTDVQHNLNLQPGAERQDEQRIPVIEEQLRIGKRARERGRITIYARQVAVPVQEQLRLREEQLNVERHTIDRPLSESASGQAFQERHLQFSARAEEATVEKQARVVEEVRLSKHATERIEHIDETVRHTEIDVQNRGDDAAASPAGGRPTSTQPLRR